MDFTKFNFVSVVVDGCSELVNDNLLGIDTLALCKQLAVYEELCLVFDFVWLSILIDELQGHINECDFNAAKKLVDKMSKANSGLK